MGYVIERQDGSVDGLGDAVVFRTAGAAWAAAEAAFGRDIASELSPEGVRGWLRVREVDQPAPEHRAVVARDATGAIVAAQVSVHARDAATGLGATDLRWDRVVRVGQRVWTKAGGAPGTVAEIELEEDAAGGDEHVVVWVDFGGPELHRGDALVVEGA